MTRTISTKAANRSGVSQRRSVTWKDAEDQALAPIYARTAFEEPIPKFELLSDGSELPVFAFALKDASRSTVFDLSDTLRQGGWQVPAYTKPPDAEDIAVLRVVVREGFSRDLADTFVEDLQRAVDHFAGGLAATTRRPTVFKH